MFPPTSKFSKDFPKVSKGLLRQVYLKLMIQNFYFYLKNTFFLIRVNFHTFLQGAPFAYSSSTTCYRVRPSTLNTLSTHVSLATTGMDNVMLFCKLYIMRPSPDEFQISAKKSSLLKNTAAHQRCVYLRTGH